VKKIGANTFILFFLMRI